MEERGQGGGIVNLHPVVKAAREAARGNLAGVPTTPGNCLVLVRVIVQQAYKISYDEFYSHRTNPVPRDYDRHIPWARDMERSLRPKWSVRTRRVGPPNDPFKYVDWTDPAIKPGDILFKWDTAENKRGDLVGHVAIYLGAGFLIENVDPAYRYNSFRNSRNPTTNITPLGEWAPTTIVRWGTETPVSFLRRVLAPAQDRQMESVTEGLVTP